VTALERHPDNRETIGQWTDEQHRDAMAGRGRVSHSIIERDGVPEGFLIGYDRRAEVGGIYVKRIVVNGKDRGTGTRALQAFVDAAFARGDVDLVWLLVRDGNARAQAVYRKLGFVRFEPGADEAPRFDAGADTPNQSFRMILRRG